LVARAGLRLGLIGFGDWGQLYAAVAREIRNVRVVAIATMDPESFKEATDFHRRAHIYHSYQEMLQQEELDAVIVSLPSHLHESVGLAVLEAGCHLLVEAPMALTCAQCRRLIEAATGRGLLLAVGHTLRYSALWNRVKQIIQEGGIGQPQYVHADLFRVPYRLGCQAWRYRIAQVGSWIFQEPLHLFDLARWYLDCHGNPTSVFARVGSHHAEHPELHDHFGAVLSFPHQAFAVIACTVAAFGHHQSIKVVGTEGAIDATWGGDWDDAENPTVELRHFDGRKIRDVHVVPVARQRIAVQSLLTNFIDAVQGRDRLAVAAEDGLWAVAMCQAAQRAAKMRSAVAIRIGS